jgi:hypothetical protein
MPRQPRGAGGRAFRTTSPAFPGCSVALLRCAAGPGSMSDAQSSSPWVPALRSSASALHRVRDTLLDIGGRALRITSSGNTWHALKPVIASEAKQSMAPRGKLDCFVARAPRNDVVGVDSDFKQQKNSRGVMSPEVLHLAPPSKVRGRREDRVRAAPAVSCASSRGKKAHTSIQVQREHSGLPCAVVLGL